jgi:hypothetical protein
LPLQDFKEAARLSAEAKALAVAGELLLLLCGCSQLSAAATHAHAFWDEAC